MTIIQYPEQNFDNILFFYIFLINELVFKHRIQSEAEVCQSPKTLNLSNLHFFFYEIGQNLVNDQNTVS